MKTCTKAALFGGALFAAGLAGVAEADWIVDQNYSFHQVFGADGQNTGFVFGSGSSHIDFNGGNPFGTGDASISQSLLYTAISITGGGWAQGRVNAFITVSSPQTVYADWDFTSVPPGGFTYATIEVTDLTNSAIMLDQGPGTAGSGVALNLVPGVEYRVILQSDSDSPSNMFAQISKSVIPAPSALALLAVGAVGSRRRRRS